MEVACSAATEGTVDRMRTAVVSDPHPIWLDAVSRVLEREGLAVVGVATDADAAVGLVAAHEPDVFVTEMSRGEEDAFAIIRDALRRAPAVKVIVLSATDDAASVRGAIGAGAVAYVVKTADPEDVAFAVRHTFRRSIFLSSPDTLAGRPAESPDSDALRVLTKRELEILRLVAEGDSNIQLARRLWVTEQTVKFHLSNIYRKLGVANRTEASRWAQRHGLLETPPAAESDPGPPRG
jgi:DNA-binding NarL/FixJ family response regulator